MTRLQEKTKSAVRASSSDGASSPHPRAGRGNGLAIETARAEGGGAALKLLRFPAVRERTGLSRSTICDWSGKAPFRATTESPRTRSHGSRTTSLSGFDQRWRGSLSE
jgi:predicted DNA-binding transcriptional regulator AlpA